MAAPIPAASQGDVGPLLLVMLGVIVVLWALVRYPARGQERERLRWRLDAGTVMVGAAGVMWYELWTLSDAVVLTRILVAMITAGVMLVCAFGLIYLLMVEKPPFSRATGIAGGISGGLIAIAMIAAAIAPASTGVSFDAYLQLRLAPQFLLVATPWIQRAQLRADPQLLVRPPRRRYSRLPYLVAVANQVLLVGALVREGLDVRAWECSPRPCLRLGSCQCAS